MLTEQRNNFQVMVLLVRSALDLQSLVEFALRRTPLCGTKISSTIEIDSHVFCRVNMDQEVRCSLCRVNSNLTAILCLQ